MKLVGKFLQHEDTERMAARKEKQKQLASLKAVQHTQQSITTRIATANSRKPEIEAKFQATIAPAESELAECEALVSECILTGKEIPEDVYTRQAAAHAIIEKAKDRKLVDLEGVARVVKQLESQRRVHSVEQEMAAIRGELSGPLANPQFLLDRFVCDQACQWLDKRLREAREELERAESDVRSHVLGLGDEKLEGDHAERRSGLLREVEKWQAEIAATELELSEAVRYRQEVRDKILAE